MPYLANIDGLIWLVIIVVSIISQIVKATRKASANAPQKVPPRANPAQRGESTGAAPQQRTRTNRADELRQFFETLGMPVPEAAAPPQPQRKKKSSRAQAARVAPAPAPVVVPQLVTPRRQTQDVQLESLQKEESTRTRELRDLLLQERSQRQAILLREILGPPLALR